MKRMIGIDLGTSSSMVKTKEYPDGVKPEAVSLDCKAVVFTQQKMGSTPTLIREWGEKRWHGYEAEHNTIKNSTLYQNFKIDLLSKDPQTRERAKALTEDFFGFLYGSYTEQRRFLFDLTADFADDEVTMVSYPAQWDEAQREIVLNAARKAGFLNVKGMDEATASVHCILNAKKGELIEKGLLQAGKPLNAVIVDMGAGTADLAFVRVVLDGGLKTEILDTWPPADSNYMFGGSRMDVLLAERMEKWLEDSGLAPTQAKNIVKGHRSAIKQWKELTVSPLLASGQEVDDCAAVSGMCACMGQDLKPFPVLNRKTFAQDYWDYFETFVRLLNSAPKELRDEVQLVILTGGNSQWYWIDEILTGADTRFGQAGLPQIAGHPGLLLRMELPTETVSRGLVYSVLPLEIKGMPEKREPEHPAQPEVRKDERVTPKIEPVYLHRFDMPVEPNQMENLNFEQARALSQYVRRHIAGDGLQQVLVTQRGQVITNRLTFKHILIKNQIDHPKLQNVSEVWWDRGCCFLFRKQAGSFLASSEDLLDSVVSHVDESVFTDCVFCDYRTLSNLFVAVLRNGTVFIKSHSEQLEEKLHKLVDGLTDIVEAHILENKGLLCLTRSGRLLPLPLNPEKEESKKILLSSEFPGEIDIVNGRTLYGRDIETIRFDCIDFFPQAIIALKKGGRAVCYGAMDDRIKGLVASWVNIVSVDISYSRCFGLQSNGSLLYADKKAAWCLRKDCIGFAASDSAVLAVTRDGVEHTINFNILGQITSETTLGNLFNQP